MTKVPPSIAPLINGYTWSEVTIGESSASTFLLTSETKPFLYLKVGPKEPTRGVYQERERLEWLHGKLLVPEVIGYAEDELHDYLLTSALGGKDAVHAREDLDSREIVCLLAEGLRTIHALPMGGCPFDRSLARDIESAGYNMAHGIVDEADFDESRVGRPTEELYKELLDRKPTSEDLVFTHGDYCLPNIILNGTTVGGFVDWGRAGIADRYKDLALATRSIRYNLGPGLELPFFQAYGIRDPDPEKIDYYRLLDEFF